MTNAWERGGGMLLRERERWEGEESEGLWEMRWERREATQK